MSELKPLPCPFCGGAPQSVERPDNIDGTRFFYALACYCGGYSACAHKMAVEPTPEQAKRTAIEAWNRRAQPAQAGHFHQALTDPENQPNQYGVEFLMHGPKFAFKVGAQQFTLDYEPTEPGEFEFMRDMLIHAFTTFTPDVKTAQAGQVLTDADWPDVDDMAHSALQEALAFGLNHDAFYRYGRDVLAKAQIAAEQAVLAKRVPMYDKTELNAFVQDLYNRKMEEGKHGHYETMFHCVHQAIKRVGIVGEKGGA